MLTCTVHVNIIIWHVDIIIMHVNIIKLHVDKNKFHVNIITVHVNIIYLVGEEVCHHTIVLIFVSYLKHIYSIIKARF